MRRKVARDKSLDRAARCKKASNRPVCPSCHTRMPPPGARRDDFLLPHGHRRKDGEVCDGFRTRPSIAPPPPMTKPPPKWVDPARPVAAGMSVAEWMSWFDDHAEAETQQTPSPRPPSRKPARETPDCQLRLFTGDALWCDPPANSQDRYPLVAWQSPRRCLQTG